MTWPSPSCDKPSSEKTTAPVLKPGLFSCIPNSVCAAQELLNTGDISAAKHAFERMIAFRDELIAIDLWPAFSYAMNLLGCAGSFAPDYEGELTVSGKERVRKLMRSMGEIT